MSNWYSIKAQGPKAAAEIYIYGDIGESWYEETTSAAQFVKDLNALTNEDITIRLNSVGGSVPDGLAIYNAIQRHPSNIRISIDGMAMSIASLIAMAAPSDMSENALMMIHAPWSIAAGNAKDFRDHADMLDKWSEAMATSYASKTGKDSAEIMALLTDGADHYYTAAEAQAEGFVDNVVAAMPIAASGRIPADVLARYQSLPKSANQFVIHAAPAANPDEDDSMNREDQIRAHFKDYIGKPGVQALLDACIADEAITPEAALEKLTLVLQPKAPDSAEIAASVLAKDKTRRDGIKAQFAKVPAAKEMTDLLETCLDDHTITPEAAGLKILDKLGEGATPVGATAVHIIQGQNSKDLQDEIVGSILARAGKADDKTRDMVRNSSQRHLTLMELAKASLSRAGVDTSGLSSPKIAMAALTQSTSDFPVLLENAMHKALLQGYNSISDTWSRFCKTGSVSDFRAHNRYRTGTIGNYQTVNENGEYINVAIPDGKKETISAVDRGLIINLTYQMIVNDDLNAFVGLASDLGRAGRRTVESAVYALLAENAGLGPTMGDSVTLFHADHGNLTTGAALSAAAIDLDRVAMGSQQDISGNDFLDLRPSVLLVPLSLGSTARTINDSQYDPDTLANKSQMKPNSVRGLFRDVVDTARMTGTRRYLFADPNEAPVIEVAFLNGESEPYIVMEEAFSSRGTKYRATLDFGVDAIGYEGAVTNAGA